MAVDIKFGVGFDVDQSSLNKLKASLQEIQKMTRSDFLKANPQGFQNINLELLKVKDTAKTVEQALNNAFNIKLDSLNILSFNNELKRVGLTTSDIYNSFRKAGSAGQAAFQDLGTSVLTANTNLKQTNTILDRMAKTFGNTLKWNVASSVINSVNSRISDSIEYVKELNRSLNDIRIVTGLSASEMDNFAEKANDAAKVLGKSTTDYTDAALIYYQQGLGEEDVQARAEVTLKAAAVTQEAPEKTSEQLTAVWNGYKIGAEGAELAVDKLAKVAATTAADLRELSVGMSRVASSANAMGIDIDQLNAQIATIISVTRQAPESVGTALKTIFARMTDLKLGDPDEDGVILGDIAKQMKQAGIDILDVNGELRDLGIIIEEVADKWDIWSRKEQVAMAQALAGRRQYNNLVALYDNWDMYSEALETSRGAAGTLNEQHGIYMEGTAAHLEQFKASAQDVYDSLLDVDAMNSILSVFTELNGVLADWIDLLGGGTKAMSALGSVILNVFNKQIGLGIGNIYEKFKTRNIDIQGIIDDWKLTGDFTEEEFGRTNLEELARVRESFLKYDSVMNDNQRERMNLLIKETSEQMKQNSVLEDKAKIADDFYKKMADAGMLSSKDVDIVEQARKTGQKFYRDGDSPEIYSEYANLSEHAINYADKFSDLSDEGNKLIDSLKDSYQGTNNNLKEYAKARTEFDTLQKQVTKATATGRMDDNLFASFMGAELQMNELAKGNQEFYNTFSLLEDKFRSIIPFADETTTAFKTLKDTILVDDDGIDLESFLGLDDEQREKVLNAMREIGIEVEAFAQKNAEVIDTIAQGQANIGSAGAKELKDQMEALQKSMDFKRKAQEITKLVGSIGQLNAVMNTLTSLSDVFSRDDINSVEKTRQALIGLTSALPMAITGFISLRSALTGLGVAAGSLNIAAGGIIALVGAVSVISNVINAKEQERLANIGLMESERDLVQSNLESAAAAEKKYQAYKKIYDNYTVTGQGEKELAEAVAQLDDSFKAQIDTIDLLSGRYDFINGKIEETRVKQLEASIDEYNRAGRLNEAIFAGVESRDGGSFGQFGLDENDPGKLGNFLIKEGGFTLDEWGQEVKDALYGVMTEVFDPEQIETALDLTGGSSLYGTMAYEEVGYKIKDVTQKQNLDFIIALFNALEEWEKDENLSKELEKFSFDDRLRQIARENSELINKERQREADFKNTLSELSLTKTTFEEDLTIDEVKSKVEEVKTAIKDSFNSQELSYTEEEIDTYANKALSKISSIQSQLETINIQDSILGRMFGDPARITNEAKTYIESLDPELLKVMATIGINESASLENIQKVAELAKIKLEEEMSVNVIRLVDEASNSLVAAGSLSEMDTKDHQSFINELSSLEGINEAKSALEEFNALAERGSLAQLNYLQDWMDKYQQNTEHATILERERLYDQLEQAKAYQRDLEETVRSAEIGLNLAEGNAKINSNLAESNAAIEEARARLEAANKELQNSQTLIIDLKEQIDSTDWIIDLGVEATDAIVNAGNIAINQADTLKDAALLIGEGFQVAASDAAELANILPGIYENAYNLGNGLIQLDKEVVEIILQGQADIVNGDVQSTIERAQLRLDEINARKEQVAIELQMWQDISSGKIAISEEEFKLLALGQEELTNYLIQKGVDEKTAREAVNKAMAGDWEELNTIVGQVADDIDDNVSMAMEEAANNTQTNVNSMIDNFRALIRVAQEAGKAIRAAAKGQVAGNANVAGATKGGSRAKNFSSQSGVESFKGAQLTGADTGATESFKPKNKLSEKANAFIDNKISELQKEQGSLEKQSAALLALIAKAEEHQMKAAAATGGALSGVGGREGLNPSKKSGGGSGSKAKEEKAEQLDMLENEADRYREINIQIKNIEKSLSRLSKLQSKMSGKDLINNMNEQLSILNQQKQAYAAKITLARQEAAEVRSSLSQYGAMFNAQGQLINYQSLMASAIQRVNEAIAVYNALTAEQQKADGAKSAIDEAKANYETIKKLVGEYDKVINDTIPDLEDKITDALFKEIEIQVEKFNMEFILKLDMSEAERSWNEFKRKVINDIDDDDLLGRVTQSRDDFLSYYQNRRSDGSILSEDGIIDVNTRHTNDILSELYKMDAGGHSSVYSAYDSSTGKWADDRKQAIEDLKTSYQQLMDDLMALEDLERDVEEAFLGAIDAVAEMYDKQTATFEFFEDQLNHDIKMVQMLYGDDAFGKLADYFDEQVKGDEAKLNALREQAAYWHEMMTTARAMGDEEAYDKYLENWKKSIGELNATIEQWADNLLKKYKNSIDDIMKTLNDGLTDGLGLDYTGEEFNLINMNAENYLDTINAAYETQKLRNKWNDAIDNTKDLAIQQKLTKIMNDQLGILEDKEKISKYEIDRANLIYELTLKQMALDEARANKTKLRLRRDANGAYSFQYVAEEDEDKGRLQELADLQNQLYNFDKEAYQKNLDEAYTIWVEFQEKLAKAHVDYANDEIALAEQVALLKEQYEEKLTAITEQNLIIRDNLSNSALQALIAYYNADLAAYQAMVDENGQLFADLMNNNSAAIKAFADGNIEEFNRIAGANAESLARMIEDQRSALIDVLIPQWSGGVQLMIDKFSGPGGFEEVTRNTFNELSRLAIEYQQEQMRIGDVSQAITNIVSQQKQILHQESMMAVQASQQELMAIQQVRQELQGLIQDYRMARQAAIEATRAAYDYWMQEQQIQANASKQAAQMRNFNQWNDPGANVPGPNYNTPTSGGMSNAGKAALLPRTGAVGGTVRSTAELPATSSARSTAKLPATSSASAGSSIVTGVEKFFEGLVGGIKKILPFDTGGYTGGWSEGDGRLALLHQKELVLNADDTKNMLSSIELLRGIVSAVGAEAIESAAITLNGIGQIPGGIEGAAADSLEQTVYIDAKFEGQTEATQIEMALRNLTNTAAQRAYRNKKD